MITISPFEFADRQAVEAFVAAIQEHERAHIHDLKTGGEIAEPYADLIIDNASKKNGCILMARADGQIVGFVCAWMDEDDDPLLRDDARQHAIISDLYVIPDWRRRGVALQLLEAIEQEMAGRGAKRIRVTSKATNDEAISIYHRARYHPYEVIHTKRIEPFDKQNG